jgi:alkylation response protein AidB-like acyl-CoA dehydrogenase
LQAKKTAGGYALGTKAFVPEGMAATTFVVAARTRGAAGETAGITLFLVPANAKGLSRRRLSTFDSRGYANLEFANVEVEASAVLCSVDNGYGLLDGILDRARAGLSAEMLGTAAQAFDMTLSYLKTRVQFGKVIGSFRFTPNTATLFQHGARTLLLEGALQALDAKAAMPELCSL